MNKNRYNETSGFECSVVIPNYNGRYLLERFFPDVLKVLFNNQSVKEVIIVDDGSSDDSIDFIKSKFPQVTLIKLEKNMMFTAAISAGVKASSSEFVILLNNDMFIHEDFVTTLLKHFHSTKLFAVSAKVMLLDKKTLDNGRQLGKIRYGFFNTYGKHSKEIDKGQIDFLSHVLTVETGAFNKSIFQELGGLDSSLPLWFSLVDIGYRAWKMGYYSLYEPKSVVYHRESSTTGKKEYKDKFQFLYFKESLLFMWKNFSDLDVIFKHILLFPFWFLANLVFSSSRKIFFRAVLDALGELRSILNKRPQSHIRGDKEVLELSQLPEPSLLNDRGILR